MSEQSKTAVVTANGKIRFSYLNVFEPKAVGDGEPKYSVALLINKKDEANLKSIKNAIAAAKALGKETGKYGQKSTEASTFKNPLRDGDAEKPDDPVYAGHYFINANNTKPVGVIGPDAKRISDFNRDSVYSGCYGNAAVNFFPFNFNGTIGVGCGLNAIQKVADGEPLGGTVDPESLFAAVEGNDLL